MNKSTILRTTFFILLIATFAASKDKTPPTYQKGTISGYETRMDTKVHSYGNGNFGSATRHTKVYELKVPTWCTRLTIVAPSSQANSMQGNPWTTAWTARGSTYSTITKGI